MTISASSSPAHDGARCSLTKTAARRIFLNDLFLTKAACNSVAWRWFQAEANAKDLTEDDIEDDNKKSGWRDKVLLWGASGH